MSIAAHNGAEQVQALLAATVDAWKRGDAEAYAACFTEDCRYIAFFGSVYRGRREVAESHRVLFAGPLANTRLFVETIELRFLSADTAILLTRGDAGRKQPRRLRKLQSYVASHQKDGWLFAHFQNTKRLSLMRYLTYRAGAGAVPSLNS
jgi:uncharacterized protein (TIGR02246 family)